MKKRLRSLLLVVSMMILGVMGLTACSEAPPPTTPQKLAAPVVTLTDNTAAWEADTNADKFEISLDGNLSYVENSVTSQTLTDGQTLKVRAIGNGSTYSTGDWSNSVTYTAGTPTSQPTKLGIPTVTISSTGLASWTAVANASSYVYKINGGAETPTTATSVQLTDGQSIVVKAVGDGTNYTDSDYSATQTYTAGTPAPTPAPTYLGIFASNKEPSSVDGLPGVFSVSPMLMSYRMMSMRSYRAFGTALDEYFADSNHHFNANFPTESEYDIYSASGQTVYIQIWLNNPNQHTILSLKLNGTKYQVGGGLSSFFIKEGGQHYNCVYVAVTIPNDTYTEKTYTVTDIEYIADTYINADGTDEFMNNNDTVSIGLPYNAQNPTISDFNPTSLTINSCSATLNVADASSLLNLTGGWLGIAVYDGYNIVANQNLVIGNNTVSATGLVENTTYWITVYLYADLHDGNGVTAHILFEQTIQTPEAITVDEVNGTLLYNSEKDGYYGAIKVNTTLNSNTAEYIKLEILNGEQEVVYTDTSYNGTATVSEGILCGNSYTVRVYYKDTEYTQGKYIEENAWVEYLGTPWYQEAGGYAFVNDAVYYFQLSNGDANYPIIDSFTLKLYNEESARWVASDVLYLLDNPTAIDDLQTQINALYDEFNAAYGNDELMWSINEQITQLDEQKRQLEKAQWFLENRAGNNTDKAYWQAEAAKGKYFYEFEYSGTDTEKIFKVGKYFYVVLDDALMCGVDGFDVQIDYKYDKQEGGDLAEGVVKESFNIQMLNYYNGTEVRNVELNGNTLTFSLVNVDDYSISDLGGETTYKKGYVYKIYARTDSWEWFEIYSIDSIPTFDVDEDAWLAEYIRRIKAGESVDGLYDLYVPKYEDSYSVTLDLSNVGAGLNDIKICTRKMSEVYEEDEWDRELSEQIGVYKQLPTPRIEFAEYEGQYEGQVVHDWLNNWFGGYSYEAKDQNGNPVTISTNGGSSFNLPAPGTQVRVKLTAEGYWLESEWSEWYTFKGIKVTAPTLGEYSTTNCTISWSLDHTENISHYVYTINNGTPVRVELNGTLSVFLNNGDVFRVKCVPTTDAIANGYVDSAWAEYTCTDSRTALVVPSNVKIENGTLSWDAVDGANYYIIEVTFDSEVSEVRSGKTSYTGMKSGATYRVRAMPKDAETQRSSDWSESVTYTNE